MAEYREDHGDHVVAWLCPVPAVGLTYRVVSETWNEETDPPLRTIHKVKVFPAPLPSDKVPSERPNRSGRRG